MLVFVFIFLGSLDLDTGSRCLPGFASTWIRGTRRFALKSFMNTSIYSYLMLFMYIYNYLVIYSAYISI